MRILFISSSPIRKDISIGNTFLNVFDGIDNVEFASICTKPGIPDFSVSRCYCITEKMLVKNLLGKGKAGKELDLNNADHKAVSSKDSNAVSFIKLRRWSIFFWMQNALWRVGRWKSAELTAFVEDYQADIIFTVLSDKIFLNRLIRHVISLTDAKTVVYAWDNNYSLKKISFSPFAWITHFCNRSHMRKVVKKADKFYVISELQKKDYEKAFHKTCAVITKAADFSAEPRIKESLGIPLRMVYTGNLYANRWRSLGMLVNVLERVNKEGIKAQLYIYSATQITDKMRRSLEKEGISYLMGCVSSEEVEKIQKDADILVLAEPTDLKNRLTVRQSFSTKIVDYFKMARPIVSVGPKNIASNEHLIKNDCAIVADNEQELYEKLSSAFSNAQQLQEYAIKAYMCGRSNHDKKKQKEIISQDLSRLI